ncbi:polysaccharide deacetylase family protein [Bdellovibrio sp. HCB209]|uniref:polysaccharide deacetylase family protein n=1 Tax=Bdellovibrio sp. HCB209 TaxID=3394354 RepID=UPI0039B4FEEF
MKRFFAMSLVAMSFQTAMAQSTDSVSLPLGPVPSNEELIEMQGAEALQNRIDSMTYMWGDECRFAIKTPDRVTPGTIALTFDDGPSRTTTPIVLDTLKKHGAKATFFILGGKVAGNEDILKRIVKEGHILANHSYNHPNFRAIDSTSGKNQIYQTDLLLRKFVTPKFLRYPYGNSTCATNTYAKSLGYSLVGWNIDTCDWAFANSGYVSDKNNKTCQAPASLRGDYAGYVNHVVSQTNGGILLMHDIHMNTAKTLDKLMTKLLQQGYRFVNLDDTAVFPKLNQN